MGVIIPPGYSEISVLHDQETFTGSTPTWTLGCGSDNVAEVAEAVSVWGLTEYAGILSTTWATSAIRVTTSEGAYTAPQAVAGTRSGSPAPPNIAVLVGKESGVGGRRNRGRMYLPGVLNATELNPAGTIDTEDIERIQDCLDLLVVALNFIEAPPVILHADGGTPTPCGLVVRPVIATQRRRLRG